MERKTKMGEQHHEELVKGIADQLKPILEKSKQGIYIYLDDTHKTCNRRFADLLGYDSPKVWADTEAPLADVVEEDQDAVVSAYENATEKMNASILEVRVKNIKTGKPIKTRMIMVPITYQGHLFALHFLSRV
jgi:hypothetical protein